MKRFDLCANTYKDAINYINNRAVQIAHTGVILKSIEEFDGGIFALFEYNNKLYCSIYILNDYRGHNLYYKIWKNKCELFGYTLKILTTSRCALSSYLKYKGIPHILINGLTNTAEYKLIETTYNDIINPNNNTFYMNHIDEGLYILYKLDASLEAKLGYILYPLFQTDNKIKLMYNHTDLNNLSNQAIINAIEYRSVANEYLSHKIITDIDDIRLSPLKDVNMMLIADKIQGRKDIEKYQKTDLKYKQLLTYFKNWLNILNITENKYLKLKNDLNKIIICNNFILN